MSTPSQVLATTQHLVAVSIVVGAAVVLAVPLATLYVWRGLQDAFEGKALDDMYDLTPSPRPKAGDSN